MKISRWFSEKENQAHLHLSLIFLRLISHRTDLFVDLRAFLFHVLNLCLPDFHLISLAIQRTWQTSNHSSDIKNEDPYWILSIAEVHWRQIPEILVRLALYSIGVASLFVLVRRSPEDCVPFRSFVVCPPMIHPSYEWSCWFARLCSHRFEPFRPYSAPLTRELFREISNRWFVRVVEISGWIVLEDVAVPIPDDSYVLIPFEQPKSAHKSWSDRLFWRKRGLSGRFSWLIDGYIDKGL